MLSGVGPQVDEARVAEEHRVLGDEAAVVVQHRDRLGPPPSAGERDGPVVGFHRRAGRRAGGQAIEPHVGHSRPVPTVQSERCRRHATVADVVDVFDVPGQHLVAAVEIDVGDHDFERGRVEDLVQRGPVEAEEGPARRQSAPSTPAPEQDPGV